MQQIDTTEQLKRKSTWLQEVMRAEWRSELHCRTLGDVFTDDRVESVVNAILLFPEKFYDRVVRLTDETYKRSSGYLRFSKQTSQMIYNLQLVKLKDHLDHFFNLS